MSANIRRISIALLATVFALAGAMAGARGDTADKWRMHTAGKSTSDGEIVLRLAELGGIVAEVTIPIPKYTDQKGIAQRIREGLNDNLPGDRYKVEVDEGDDIIVRKRDDVKDFELSIVGNTADGTEVKVERVD